MPRKGNIEAAANLHLPVATSGQISRLLHIGGGVGVMGKQEEKEEVVGDQVGVGGHLLPRLPDPPTIWSPPSHHIQELPVTPGSHNRSPILASHWCGNNPPMSLCSSKRLSCCSKEKGRATGPTLPRQGANSQITKGLALGTRISFNVVTSFCIIGISGAAHICFAAFQLLTLQHCLHCSTLVKLQHCRQTSKYQSVN